MKIKYVADDGREFDTSEACEKYEDTVLREKQENTSYAVFLDGIPYIYVSKRQIKKFFQDRKDNKCKICPFYKECRHLQYKSENHYTLCDVVSENLEK